MLRLIGRRLLALPIVLVAVGAMTFVLISFSPYDAMTAYSSGSVGLSAEEKQRISTVWGMDVPVYVQFGNWIAAVAKGNLGNSRLLGGQPVLEEVLQRLAPTVVLLGSALILTMLGGLIAGTLAVRFQGSWLDTLIQKGSYFSISAPTFWTGLILIWIFSIILGWFPAGGTADLRASEAPMIEIRYLVLPSVALALTQFAWFAMFIRQQLLEAVESDYLTFARSHGVDSTSLLFRHALPNAVLPFLTLAGMQLSELIGGAILVETVFDWPGLGQLAVSAARNVDIPLLLGITLFGAVAVVLGNLIADVFYRLINPQIRAMT